MTTATGATPELAADGRRPVRRHRRPGRAGAGRAALGRRDLRRRLRHHLVDGRRAARAPGRAAPIPGVHVVFLDTGYHFAETIGTRDWIAGVLPVTLVNVTRAADRGRAGRSPSGRSCTSATPTCCCELRKVQPLARTLAGYAAWGSGVRRDESADPRGHPAGRLGRQARRWSRSTRSRPGPRTTSTPTSPSTRCRSTRWWRSATPRSAARRAPARSPPARTPAPGAGPGATKTECGLHT